KSNCGWLTPSLCHRLPACPHENAEPQETRMLASDVEQVCGFLGELLLQLYRIYYHEGNHVDTDEGGLTLVFKSGRILRFSGTPHGYGLSVHTDRFASPAGGSPDPEVPANADWEGYREVNVSGEAHWRRFIGQEMTCVSQLVYRPHDEVAGISLQFSD